MMQRISSMFANLVYALVVLGCTIHAPGSFADVSDADAKWVPTGNLTTPRAGSTATLLADGTVLVVGGISTESQYSNLTSAEIYEPITGVWSPVGSLAVARSGHTATLLANGKVLVVGGARGDSISDAEVYDPATRNWNPTGRPFAAIRVGHTATLLPDGNVLVAGGFDRDVLQLAEVYDPATGTWRATGGLLVARTGHSATRLQNGKVLVAGGAYKVGIDEDFWLTSAELYDPVTGKWAPTGELVPSMFNQEITALQDGKVLATGYVSQLYDPTTGLWKPAANPTIARSSHTSTLLPNGEVLVAGGYAQFPLDASGATRTAERYDPVRANWRSTSDLNYARSWGHTATLLKNGKVLVAGGMSPDGLLASAELYTPVTHTARYTGSWFDPAQSGHGFALEVLRGKPMQLLASWFTFAPQGGQAWIVGLGPIDGNRAVLRGFRTAGTGGRFPPNFDAVNVVEEDWGTLTFTFSDCDHGHVDWESSEPGYGSGGMDLTRLILPAGLTCSTEDAGGAMQ